MGAVNRAEETLPIQPVHVLFIGDSIGELARVHAHACHCLVAGLRAKEHIRVDAERAIAWQLCDASAEHVSIEGLEDDLGRQQQTYVCRFPKLTFMTAFIWGIIHKGSAFCCIAGLRSHHALALGSKEESSERRSRLTVRRRVNVPRRPFAKCDDSAAPHLRAVPGEGGAGAGRRRRRQSVVGCGLDQLEPTPRAERGDILHYFARGCTAAGTIAAARQSMSSMCMPGQVHQLPDDFMQLWFWNASTVLDAVAEMAPHSMLIYHTAYFTQVGAWLCQGSRSTRLVRWMRLSFQLSACMRVQYDAETGMSPFGFLRHDWEAQMNAAARELAEEMVKRHLNVLRLCAIFVHLAIDPAWLVEGKLIVNGACRATI